MSGVLLSDILVSASLGISLALVWVFYSLSKKIANLERATLVLLMIEEGRVNDTKRD